MEYWIIGTNDEPTGPLSLDAIKAAGITPSTPVWHEGLPDWTTASSVPELQQMFAPPVPSVPVIPPDVPATSCGCQPVNAPAVAYVAVPVAEADVCPPNYLVLAIIVTVLCFFPLGIPAIIYAARVKSYFRSGDIVKARKTSERAALFVILSFVVGLIAIPFQMVFQMI